MFFVAIFRPSHDHLRRCSRALVPKVVNAERGSETLILDAKETISSDLVFVFTLVADLCISNCFEKEGGGGYLQVWSKHSLIFLWLPQERLVAFSTKRLTRRTSNMIKKRPLSAAFLEANNPLRTIFLPVVRMVMSAEQSNRLSFILFICNEVDACVRPFFTVKEEKSVRKDFVNKMRWLGLRRQIQKTFSTR